MKSKILYLIKLLLVFAILYDINFLAFPSITTARVALLLLILYAFYYRIRIPILIINYLALIGCVFSLALIQFLFSQDSTQISRIFWFVLYGIIGPVILSTLIKDKNEYFLFVTLSTFIQSIIALTSFITPSFKLFLYSTVIFTANFDEAQVLRAVSLSSVAGASLSVIQSFGVISALILLKYKPCSVKFSVFLWLQIVIITISIFIIGRTGLIISFLALLIFIFSFRFTIKRIVVIIVSVFLIFQINFMGFLENQMKNVEGFNVDFFMAWIENAFSIKENQTSEDLKSMPVPALTFETIIGTGKVENLNLGGNASGHDSGYIQTYYSLGLILAFFFYVTYLLFLIYQVKAKKETVLYLLITMIFIIELKEPFIFQYALPFFILSTILVFGNSLINSSKLANNNL